MQVVSTVAIAWSGNAGATYIPPDFYGEPCRGNIGWFENAGQIVDEAGNPVSAAKFYSVGTDPKVFLFERSVVAFLTYASGATTMDPVQVNQIRMKPIGELAADRDPIGNAVKTYHHAFYLPQTAPAGAAHVAGYDRAIYENIYPDIDMHFYSGSGGQKMAFVMRPGSHPYDLHLQFNGQDSLRLDLWGNLRLYYDGKYFVLPQAVAYQVDANNTIIPISWSADYSVNNGNGVVSFSYSSYDPSLPLIFQVGALPALDPQPTPNLCWSTYLGGTNGDRVQASATDADGNFFVTGYSLSDFLTIPGAVGNALINGGQVVMIARFDADYSLSWIVFYGSSSADQEGLSIETRAGNEPTVYLGGYTTGTNLFPAAQAGAYNLQTVQLGFYRRAFIAKLSYGGQLLWSTYFGDGQSEIRGLDVDATGRLHITGYTYNQNVPLQPLNGATSWPFSGNFSNMWIARFEPTDALNWCTVHAGSGYDIECVPNGFYVSGRANGNTAQNVFLSGAYNQNSSNGAGDGYLMFFNTNAACQWATYIGGNGDEFPGLTSLAAAPNGDVYFLGTTYSTGGFPLVNAPDGVNTSVGGYLCRIRHTNKALVWSTFMNATLNGAVVAPDGRLFLAGGSTDDPAPLLPAASWYYQNILYGSKDGVLLGFTSTDQQFIGTYFGGEDDGGSDELNTLETFTNRLYLGGHTSKQYDVTSYFPLYNPGFPAYYDGFYQFVLNNVNLNANYENGYVAALCPNGLVGFNETGSQDRREAINVHAMNGALTLFGLIDGLHVISLHDASGRLLLQVSLASHDGRATLPARLEPGVYLLAAEHAGQRASVRFLITQ